MNKHRDERGENLRHKVTEDIRRYTGADCRPWRTVFLQRFAQAIYEHPALLAILIYRYGQWADYRCKVPLLRQLCNGYYASLFWWARIHLQVEVPRSTQIGPGLYIAHFGGVIINCQAVIGSGLSIGYGVVIGQTDSGVPVIGDNVEMGVGAKVIGGIRVGNNVRIGAQSVVNKDIPDGAVAVGVPARIIQVDK